jgi:hypothetical protein
MPLSTTPLPPAVTVEDLLRLAPFSLGTITVLLAAGGLLFGHAYGRYGDDAAISFLVRWRFALAAAAVAVGPGLMLWSFGNDGVPSWLTFERAAAAVGGGVLVAALTVAYLIHCVSRPSYFLASVGRRVTARRMNRLALARRWRNADEFATDIAARHYRVFGFQPVTGRTPSAAPTARRRLQWKLALITTHLKRLIICRRNSDPSEMLFDAAAAGVKNGNMRTWRSALEEVARRLRDPSLSPDAAAIVIDNALALEEVAHRQGSEDCKARLCQALGAIGTAGLPEATAEQIAEGLSTLAERRLVEHRPVTAAIVALESVAVGNPVPVARVAGKLGQHLAALAPPAAVYDLHGRRIEHPTRALYALLSELAARADRTDDGRLNDIIIDACNSIAIKLPDQQDAETIDTLAGALQTAGEAATTGCSRTGTELTTRLADWRNSAQRSASLTPVATACGSLRG